MRRAFVQQLTLGTVRLDPAEGHHLRDVLRMAAGDTIELFDAGGNRGTASIVSIDHDGVSARVEQIEPPPAVAAARSILVASAVPKADRADWLVEKLCEIGVVRWLPLRTERSVVHPEGTTKYQRWRRLAIEAAKQSRRSGVMAIDELTTLDAALLGVADAAKIALSTRVAARPIVEQPPIGTTCLFIGPEGGWTNAELDVLIAAGAREASLGTTVLRVETAAIVAAGIVAAVG